MSAPSMVIQTAAPMVMGRYQSGVPNIPPVATGFVDRCGKGYFDAIQLNPNLPVKHVHFHFWSLATEFGPVAFDLELRRFGQKETAWAYNYASGRVPSTKAELRRGIGTMGNNQFNTQGLKMAGNGITALRNTTATSYIIYSSGTWMTTCADELYLYGVEPITPAQGANVNNNYEYMILFEVREYALGYKINPKMYR
jgi:hypothetical protein